ncbi:MAG TPA: hypothetical protein VEK08_08855 [Planctomycetota bacterium]|nr:hypothetical protein [Planctomycetota bacterium]
MGSVIAIPFVLFFGLIGAVCGTVICLGMFHLKHFRDIHSSTLFLFFMATVVLVSLNFLPRDEVMTEAGICRTFGWPFRSFATNYPEQLWEGDRPVNGPIVSAGAFAGWGYVFMDALITVSILIMVIEMCEHYRGRKPMTTDTVK